MSPIQAALTPLQAEITALTGRFGRPVDVGQLKVIDRQGLLPLADPGLVSPNGASRLVSAADGWIAVNLAREEDRELVPAWLGSDWGEDPWEAIGRLVPGRTRQELVSFGVELGLPVAAVGEVSASGLDAPTMRLGAGRAGGWARPLRVVDLSALWAGPMCGAILARMGAAVTKVESSRRPDPTRVSSPEFHRRLNGEKTPLTLDLAAAGGQARLAELIVQADVLITGMRPRALPSLGLTVEAMFAANPALVWVAITGYGWSGLSANRVAFGDDAAAAGGLVGWTGGEPRFLGDALADPVTGLAAAVGALKALDAGGGLLVDVAMARCAAGAAALCGFRASA